MWYAIQSVYTRVRDYARPGVYWNSVYDTILDMYLCGSLFVLGCEEIRYDDLFMVHSGKWIFIRFNPDGKGVDMEDKLARLVEEISKQIERIENEENTELLEVVKLFYPGAMNKEPWPN